MKQTPDHSDSAKNYARKTRIKRNDGSENIPLA